MAEVVRLVKIVHPHAEKRWAKEQIRLFGPGKVIGRDDLDVEAACRLVDELDSEFVPIGECGNRGPDGMCRGHLEKRKENDATDDD